MNEDHSGNSKTYHYVYCTTNLTNGKFYIGKHSTKNLDDGYMGSGKLLRKAIIKYGIENFEKRIIQMSESSEEALDVERRLVNEEFAVREDTYNIIKGGQGGFSKFATKKGWTALLKKLWCDPSYREQHSKRLSAQNKRFHAEGRLRHPTFRGFHHSQESKLAIGKANSIQQRGARNSQHGTMWISNVNLKISRKIKKEEIETWIQQGWIQGRKMKW